MNSSIRTLIRLSAAARLPVLATVAAGILIDEESENAKLTEPVTEIPAEEEYEFSEYALAELQQMLQAAIDNEEYEKASRIRDEINKRK